MLIDVGEHGKSRDMEIASLEYGIKRIKIYHHHLSEKRLVIQLTFSHVPDSWKWHSELDSPYSEHGKQSQAFLVVNM